MTSMLALFVSFLVLSGCSSATSSSSQPLLTHCNKTDRSGTYLVHAIERSGGDCGAIQDQLVQMPAASGTSPGDVTCGVVTERWSEGDCRYDSTVDCASPNGEGRFVAFSRQTAQDGSRLEGVMTARIATARSYCNSTYDVTWTRQ